eukprot:NODE_171_length_14381_cov_0.662512.p6 type:complete len:269 gc:universal NODE_171_length_14381_cov_0.662512:11589-12395(+)
MIFATFYATPLVNRYTDQNQPNLATSPPNMPYTSTPVPQTPSKLPNRIYPSWKHISGVLSQITINDFLACGTASDYTILCAPLGSHDWEVKSGLLQSIKLDGNQAVGLDSQGNIYFADDINNPNWQKVDGNLRNIDLSNGKMVGTNSNNELFVAPYGTSAWKQLQGVFLDVSIYGNYICGISSMGKQLFCAKNVDDPQWKSIDSPKFDQIELSRTRICGITRHHAMYCAHLNGQNWIKVNGNAKDFDLNDNFIYKLSPSGAIYSGKLQ